MWRITTAVALSAVLVIAFIVAPVAGGAVPIGFDSLTATATMSGDTTVIVTLSEPLASFRAQAVSGLTVVNGGHTIPLFGAVVDLSTPTQLEITTAAAVGQPHQPDRQRPGPDGRRRRP